MPSVLHAMRQTCSRWGVAILTCLLAASATGAGVATETIATTELGPPASTWFVVKAGLGSGYVFDAADGEMIGTLSLSPWTPTVRRHAERGEIYAAETHYTRRHDGERTDVLRIYAHETLAPVGEVPIPNKIAALHRHYLAILSGGRFATVFNMTPAQSVSVVDVENRRFVGEISTAGCAVTLPTGEHGFLMMCGDGTLQWIGLDADGAESARGRSASFFSVEDDPLFDDPTPTPAGWQFLSFAGLTMEAVVENGEIAIGESWSILGEDDEGWRPGGGQPATYCAGHDLLVVLMHQGGVDTQDQDGTEAWVLDRSTQRRIGRITFEAPASGLLVVEGDEPLLLAGIGGSVHVFDLATGVRQRVVQTNQGGSLLRY